MSKKEEEEKSCNKTGLINREQKSINDFGTKNRSMQVKCTDEKIGKLCRNKCSSDCHTGRNGCNGNAVIEMD